jgi:hypothetical protein
MSRLYKQKIAPLLYAVAWELYRIAGADMRWAKSYLAQQWMRAGDFGPLGDLIERREVDWQCLDLLAEQIKAGRLFLKHDAPGRPPEPHSVLHAFYVGMVYHTSDPSERTYEKVAKKLNIGVTTVQNAVTLLDNNNILKKQD